ncbi:MAG: EpsG family protein [Muribaculaceae bacterium]|nr:EpsG family protein [Muribaculaceae bacterium]
MGVYYIYFFILAFLTTIGSVGKTRLNRQAIIFLMCLCTWLLIGLRDSTVGVDTRSYIDSWGHISTWSFPRLLNEMVHQKEQLYLLICWLTGQFTSNYTVYLLVWAAFPAVALYITMRKYLETPTQYFEVIVVMCMLGLYAFFVAGIRQTAAISIVLLSFKYLKDGKLAKFLLCIAVAYLIHNSCVVFIIAYPLRYVKVKWWFPVVIIGLHILSSYIKIDLVVRLAAALFKDRFISYGTVYLSTQNNSAFIVQFVLYLICYFNIKKLIKKDYSNNILFVLLTMALFFQSMSGMLAEFSRVSFYFCVFYLILLPRALSEFKPENRFYINVSFIAFCILLLLFVSKTNLPTYHFA